MDSYSATLPDVVYRALAEDLGSRDGWRADDDLTTRITVSADRRATARIVGKQSGCLAGLELAEATFLALDPEVEFAMQCRDGDCIEPGTVVAAATGRARALLVAERTALNFLQRLSGVATLTRTLVDAVEGTGARIFDTRKTTPGMRVLERHAVVMGGGHNHRFGLFDQVLLKENHFALAAPEPFDQVVRRCVEEGGVPVIAEARTEAEAVAAALGGAAVVMLDNFEPGEALCGAVKAVRSAARDAGHRVEVEVSGGVTQANVRRYAECGVDRISVGALTHSAPSLDLSMLMEGVA